ncbi:MAG: 3-ketoacyl-ACP reductase [Vicinamibacterales bacterium]|nr:3-ketoacyl-ACP reductase [Vicinamibacterales bacterium]
MNPVPVALVTGASRGIGHAVAMALAGAGFDIAALSRTGAGQPATLPAGRRWHTIVGDVAEVDAHDTLVQQVIAEFGRLDVFISNAGIAPERRVDVLDTTPASFDRVLATNLRGTFFLAQKAARCLIACRRFVADAHPRIVFIGSVSAVASSPSRAEYCISKAGLSMVARVMADRLAAEGIPVFEVRPGIIHTDMTAPVRERYDAAIAGGLVPQGRWGEPDDVARAVVALARGDFDYATGTVIDVGGGLQIPRL